MTTTMTAADRADRMTATGTAMRMTMALAAAGVGL